MRGSVRSSGRTVIAAACIVALAAVLGACGGGSKSPVAPVPTAPDPCAIPARGDTVAVTLRSGARSYAVGDTFWVAAVLYHVGSPFGASVEIAYPSSLVRVDRVALCTSSFSQQPSIEVAKIDSAGQRVSFGATLLRGASPGASSTMVLCYLGCRALAAGNASFQLVDSKLRLVDADGLDLPALAGARRENVTIALH